MLVTDILEIVDERDLSRKSLEQHRGSASWGREIWRRSGRWDGWQRKYGWDLGIQVWVRTRVCNRWRRCMPVWECTMIRKEVQEMIWSAILSNSANTINYLSKDAQRLNNPQMYWYCMFHPRIVHCDLPPSQISSAYKASIYTMLKPRQQTRNIYFASIFVSPKTPCRPTIPKFRSKQVSTRPATLACKRQHNVIISS